MLVLILSAGLCNCSCLSCCSYTMVILWRCFSDWLFTPSKHENSTIYSPQSVISVDWLVIISGVRLFQSRIRVLEAIFYSEGGWAEVENTALVLFLSQALRMVFWAPFQNTSDFYKPVEDGATVCLQFLVLFMWWSSHSEYFTLTWNIAMEKGPVPTLLPPLPPTPNFCFNWAFHWW